MKRMICGILLMTAFAVAAAHNDLAPYDNTASDAFWVTTAHPEVATSSATSSGVSGLEAEEEIDTRTYSEAFSNILTTFCTFLQGFSIFVR